MNLDESLEYYLKYLKYEKNLAVNTLDSYGKDLKQLIDFLKKNNTNVIESIDLEKFRRFLKFMDKFKYSNMTIIRKYSSYQNYFKFCELNGLLKNPISHYLMPPKKQQKLYHFLSQAETIKLMDTLECGDVLGCRNKALLEFIYSTGARVSEVEAIVLKDLDIQKNEARVLGKGRKVRIVYLNKYARKSLEEYLKVRSNLLFSNKNESYQEKGKRCSPLPEEHLFLNRSGKKLNVRSMRNILKKCLLQAGINKKISPHGLRHSFATHLLQEGAGIREIQELLGHESITTTQIYTHLNLKKIKEDFLKFHPRGRIK